MRTHFLLMVWTHILFLTWVVAFLFNSQIQFLMMISSSLKQNKNLM
jgi:hypothetical protein